MFQPTDSTGRKPAVLVFGGSEGGLELVAAPIAALLAAHGYSALALAYFQAPGLPSALIATCGRGCCAASARRTPCRTISTSCSRITDQGSPCPAAHRIVAHAALASGVTTAQDISNIQDSPEHSDALVDALRESGLRAVFAYGNSPPRALRNGTALPEDARRVRPELLYDDGALVTMALITEPGGTTRPNSPTPPWPGN